jgi:hypothetical protein
MARLSYGNRAGRVRATATRSGAPSAKTAAEVVREIKHSQQQAGGEDYRERSLAIHGLICARCGREFESKNRHLLTVHHRDGNHHNNPPDGSNWENLCVYCHDDVHSRGVLQEYVEGRAAPDDRPLVYGDSPDSPGSGTLGDLLGRALRKKETK